jgi:DeoR family fructose operon transcriptional repressor
LEVYVLAETRRARIVDILGRSPDGVASIASLSRQFGVSEMTIRRDLDWLASRAMVTRVRGGAVAHSSRDEKPCGDRLGYYGPQKMAIAWAAAQFVKDGDRIILDAGTTTQQIASALLTRPRLTVITNNVAAMAQLSRAPQIDTILLGGSLKHQELCTVGPLVTQSLSLLSAERLFLSAAGFALPQGVTDPDMAEVEVKRAMISAAAEVILVADSSKWGKVHLVRVARVTEINRLITDDSIPAEAVSALEAAGVKVVTPASLADSGTAGVQRVVLEEPPAVTTR